LVELFPLFGFVFFGLFSPGPNVILLTASGARFGFRPTIPHIFGVALGVGIIAGVTGLGLGVLMQAFPSLTLLLKGVACVWILWMAYKLWVADPVKHHSTADQPFTFIEAILFQWINPKIWAVALSAMAYVTDLTPTVQASYLAATFSGINIGVCLFWTWAGTLLSFLLTNPSAWRIFIRVMAIALTGFSIAVFL